MTPQIDYVPRILLRIVANFLHTCIRDCRFFWVLVPPARLFAALRANSGVVEILSFDEPNNGIITLQHSGILAGTMGAIQTTLSKLKQSIGG